MKIIIPIIGFGRAGGYRVLSELANNWVKTGHQVDFLVDERSDDPYFPTNANILRFDKKGKILKNDTKTGEKAFSVNGNAFSIYFGMFRALQGIGARYDAILANHSLTAIPVTLARTGSAKKFYYIQAYEPEYYDLEKGIKAKLLKWLSVLSYKLPLHQIANAPIYIGYRGISASQWIPPGVDEAVFFRRAISPKFEPGKPWFIGVIGRHEPAKGTNYVLQAFEKLAKRDANVHLKVAFGNLPQGWSHERAEVVMPKNDNELAHFYRTVDILVAPGTVQLGACHYPVLEAMACGTPVITTGYLPANRENSWIVPIHDANAIASALEDIFLMQETEREKILANAHSAISDFYWKYIAGKFISKMNC